MVVVHGNASGGDLGWSDLLASHSADLDAAPTTPDDPCFWLYSSGSTGQPKGTIHLQHDMFCAAESFGKQVLKITENDVCLSAAKLFFAYGLGNGLYFPFSVGATAAYLPDRPTPASVYAAVARHRPTLYFGVPTLYGTMLVADGRMDGVRAMRVGRRGPAGRHPQKMAGNATVCRSSTGSDPRRSGHIFISNRPEAIRPGSSGKLVPGYEARIVDDNFQDVAVGEVGTLLVKGDSIAAGYWNKHEKTKRTMLGEWINTDDKFFKDTDGYFYYVGRADDMLKVGGIWVSPIEVEASLIEHPAVLEAAVVGAIDRENLIKPKAYIVLNAGYERSPEMEKALKDYVKHALAHYKYPRWIEFMDELPKTATGKIKRFELKAGVTLQAA